VYGCASGKSQDGTEVKAGYCQECSCAPDPDGSVESHATPPFDGATGRPAYAGDHVARWTPLSTAGRRHRHHRHASSPRPPARPVWTDTGRPLPEKVASCLRHRRGVGRCELSAVVHAGGHGDPPGSEAAVLERLRPERGQIILRSGANHGGYPPTRRGAESRVLKPRTGSDSRAC
jgi:hypothetical protein